MTPSFMLRHVLLCAIAFFLNLSGLGALLSAKEPPRAALTVNVDSFSISATFAGHKQPLTVWVATPGSAQANDPRLLPDQAILFGPYPGQMGTFAQGGWFRELAQKTGITVLGVSFPLPERWQDHLHDRSFYYYPESGAGDAWWTAYRTWCERQGQRPGKPLVTGLSGGSILAQRFAARDADKVLGAAILTGGMFQQPSLPQACPWQLVCVAGDTIEGINANLVDIIRSKRGHIEFHTVMPMWARRGAPVFEHHPVPLGFDLTAAWLRGVAVLAASERGRLPPPHRWPCIVDRDAMGTVIAGDDVRERGKIPLNRRLYSPSVEHSRLLTHLAPPLRRIALGKAPLDIAVVAKPPPSITHKGVIWYVNSHHMLGTVERDYDLRMIASQGWVAIDVGASTVANLDDMRHPLRKEFSALTPLPGFALILDPDLPTLRGSNPVRGAKE